MEKFSIDTCMHNRHIHMCICVYACAQYVDVYMHMHTIQFSSCVDICMYLHQVLYKHICIYPPACARTNPHPARLEMTRSCQQNDTGERLFGGIRGVKLQEFFQRRAQHAPAETAAGRVHVSCRAFRAISFNECRFLIAKAVCALGLTDPESDSK